jgi:hypothetical protein
MPRRGSEAITIERGDRHLNVDHVFPRKAPHRRRPDVVDAQRELSELVSYGAGDRFEVGGPARLGLDDGDAALGGLG